MAHSFFVEASKLNHELAPIRSEELTLTPTDALKKNASNSQALGLSREDLDQIWLNVAGEENTETADFLQLSNNNGLAIGWGVRQELGNNSTLSSRKFAKQMLTAHNEYRAAHQSPPLTINEDLSRLAQTWAEVLASKDTLAYDVKCDRIGMGENVARKCDIALGAEEPTAQEFVDSWYNEVNNFNWRSLEDQLNCSHFAQLVWRSSREAGFGKAISVSGSVYVVGRYKPRGIISGEFPRNVMPRAIKPAQSVADQEKRDIANRRKISNMMANKLLPAKQAKVEAAVPTPSELPRPQSTYSPELRRFSDVYLRTFQNKLDQQNTDARSHTLITQERLDQVIKDARTRNTTTQVKLGQLKRDDSTHLLTTQDRLNQVIRDARTRNTTTQYKLSQIEFRGASSQNSRADNAASNPASSPVSATGLLGLLTGRYTEDKRPAPATSPLATGPLFFSSGTNRYPANAAASPAASPSSSTILHQAIAGTHTRDRGPPESEQQVSEFSLRKFVTQMLVSHNEYRSQHMAPPLRMNAELTRHAQDWADVLAMKDKIAHDPNSHALSEGENVAMKFRIGETNFPGDVFTELWYDEIQDYNWEKNDPQIESGHFTQLIWKSSAEVGFGRAVSDTGKVYVVGRYKPPGNLKGEFKKNVIPSEDDVRQQALEEAQSRMQKKVTKSPFGALRDFGAPKPHAVATKGALKPSVASTTGERTAESISGSGGLLQQSTMENKRAPDKKAVQEEQDTFNAKKFESQLLVSHNEYRALHRSPPLRVNKELSKLAQDWAEVLATQDKMAHDPKCNSLGLGENVAMKFRRGFFNFEGDIFTEMWYHEIETYKWTGEDQLACGHFTQVVWRSSIEVGFGRAVSKSGRVYVVGRYQPPGNYSGQFGRNVLPPTRVMPKSRSNTAGRSPNHLLTTPEAEQQHDRDATPPVENPEVHGLVPEIPGFGGAKTRDATRQDQGLASGTSRRTARQAAALNGTLQSAPETESGRLGLAQLANAKLISGKLSALKFGKATTVQTPANNQLLTQSGASYKAEAGNEASFVRDFEEFPDGNPKFTNANHDASQPADRLDAAAVVGLGSEKRNWHRLIGAMLTDRRKTAVEAKHNWHRLGRALLTAGRKARAAGTDREQEKQVKLYVSELVTAALTAERSQQMADSQDGGGNSLCRSDCDGNSRKLN